jgi:hypothetical protein
MLTVLNEAASYDLVSLSDAKAALDITGSDQDAKIAGWIEQASAAISTHCNRVFAAEKIEETFRPNHGCIGLVLARYPIVTITSITEGDEAFYEADFKSGCVNRLYRDRYAAWSNDKITVVYEAGFDDIPADVQRAVIVFIQHIKSAEGRDPYLRSEAVTDIQSLSYFNPSSEVPPPEVASLIEPYRARNSR